MEPVLPGSGAIKNGFLIVFFLEMINKQHNSEPLP